jgi:hypothetical protein
LSILLHKSPLLSSTYPFFTENYLVAALSDGGELEEARRQAMRSIEIGQAREHRLEEGRGRWALADVLLRLGDLNAAECEVLAAQKLLMQAQSDKLPVTALLAAIRLAQGHVADAMTISQEVIAGYDQMGELGFKACFARLVHAEALYAAGHPERARAVIAAAQGRILRSAETIQDPACRRSFLENVPENARVLSLARAWLGSEA